MAIRTFCISLFMVMAITSGALLAEEPKPADPVPATPAGEKKGPAKIERLWARGPEIDRELKGMLALSDEQIAQIKAAIAEVQKKNDELLAKPEVAAVEKEVEEAKKALKTAEDKAKAAKGGFELNDELKKAAFALIPEDKKQQAARVLAYHPKEAKPSKEDKNKEAAPTEMKKTE
jgi:hypothetical protein